MMSHVNDNLKKELELFNKAAKAGWRAYQSARNSGNDERVDEQIIEFDHQVGSCN